jgi:hypothetical protein
MTQGEQKQPFPVASPIEARGSMLARHHLKSQFKWKLGFFSFHKTPTSFYVVYLSSWHRDMKSLGSNQEHSGPYGRQQAGYCQVFELQK